MLSHPNNEEYDPLWDRDFTVDPFDIKIYYLYVITNMKNGNTYKGRRKPRNRKNQFPDDSYWGSSEILNAAIAKHGKENFKKLIFCILIEGMNDFKNKPKLHQMERIEVNPDYVRRKKGRKVHPAFMNRKNTYNLTIGGHGGSLAGPDHPNNGKKATEETKAKMSKSMTGRKHSEEHRAKLSKAHTGKKHSVEHRANNSKAKTGTKHTAETRAKMSKAGKGKRKIFTDEHKANMSKAQTGLKHEIVTCPHCLKSGGISNMTRYHGDNCKSK